MTDTETLLIVLGIFVLLILLIVFLRSFVGRKKIGKMEQERRMLDE
jgi:hypothetical protein